MLDREHRQPLVIGLQHAVFRRRLQRIARDAEHRQHRRRSRTRRCDRIEFRPLGQFQLADDIERDVARQRDLDLVGDRLLIADQRFVAVLFGVGPQEYVLAAFDQHARFGLVARRHDIDPDEASARKPPITGTIIQRSPPPQRTAERAKIEIQIDPARRCRVCV